MLTRVDIFFCLSTNGQRVIPLSITVFRLHQVPSGPQGLTPNAHFHPQNISINFFNNIFLISLQEMRQIFGQVEE